MAEPCVMKTYAGFGWKSGFYDSSMPFRLDTWSNCIYGCLYCGASFRKALSKSKELYMSGDIRGLDLEKLKQAAGGTYRNFFLNRKRVQMGTLADPFPPIEMEEGVTLECLKWLDEMEMPLTICTKAVWWVCEREYVQLFHKNRNRWKVQFSFGATSDELAAKLEPQAPNVSAKLAAVFTLENFGIETIARFRPLIPTSAAVEPRRELLRKLREKGCRKARAHILGYDFRSEPFRKDWPALVDACGTSAAVLKTWTENHADGSYGPFVWPAMDLLKEECKEFGIEISVSPVCGKYEDQLEILTKPPALDTFRGRWSSAVGIAYEKGSVSLEDIEPLIEETFGDSPAGTMGMSGLSAREALRIWWNSPTRPNSPSSKYPNFLFPGRLDNNGCQIYNFRRK